MNFTQEQIDTIQLPIRGKSIRLSVLNQDNQTLATLEGKCIGGSLSKNANDFVRRTGSMQLAIQRMADADTFMELVDGVTVNVNGKIWLDKNIKIEIGIENYIQPYGVEPQTVWYNFGICLIDKPVRVFGADSYTMSFNVTDLATKLTGDRGGQLTALTTVFKRVQSNNSFGDFISNYFLTKITVVGDDTRYVYCGGSFGRFAIYDKWIGGFGRFINCPFPNVGMWSLSVDNKNVYIGGGQSSFAVYNKSTKTFGELIVAPFGSSSTSVIYSMAQDENNVYCGSQDYFAIYDKSTGTFGSRIFCGRTLNAMVSDGNYLYFGRNGSNSQFTIYDKTNGTFDSTTATPFSSSIICMVQDV